MRGMVEFRWWYLMTAKHVTESRGEPVYGAVGRGDRWKYVAETGKRGAGQESKGEAWEGLEG